MKASSILGLAAVTLLLSAAVTACKGEGDKPGQSFARQPAPPPSAPANGTHMKDEEILAFVNPQKLPVYTGPTGTVEGTITITGDPSPEVPSLDYHKCPTGKDMYGLLFRTGATQPGGAKTLADALVAITGYGSFFVPERNPVRSVTFEHCALDLRTIDMTIGQRLEVTSKDEALFAPILAQAQLPALMLASKNTAPVALYPPKPGYYTLVDRMELSYLRGDVYALLQPLHTVTALDGHFRIDGVPVGKVTVNTRLARLRKETAKVVEVIANRAVTVDLNLDFNAATDIPKEPVIRPSSMPIP